VADDLAGDARRLATSVKALTESVGQLSSRTQRSERLIVGLIVSLAVSVLLAGGVAFLGLRGVAALDCQAQQNAAFRESLTARSEASGEQAKQQLLDQKHFLVTLPTAAESERQKAFIGYVTSLDVQVRALDEQIAALQVQDTARVKNPIREQIHC
jgi:hypothetical protein